MSKIPRLPGDGAQANSDSNFDESSTTLAQQQPQPQTQSQPPAKTTGRPSAQTLHESFLESREGKPQ